jgi:hypothetical protein
METKTTTFGISSFNKLTPVLYRRIGNSFLVFATGFPMALGQFVIDPTLEKNLCAVIGLTALSVKAITTFFAEVK